ncbi:copper resistance protein CopC [Ktedonospora formicarum]|uniref:CopC domain-containing protein n=1 Tax=Ktedonospora formicarum TaxID=2778364 RepID=A0A8J3I222_9CHLR|nr:copper resistance protein CopC [Ktedonospora formicarum]GHO46171.1 hypothetical protein KSX_43340 [Ktedonospora formicarum]
MLKGREALYKCSIVLVLLLSSILAFPLPVQASTLHALLLRSDPQAGSTLSQPPKVVRLWFTEPVELVGKPIRVYAPSGAELAIGAASVHGLEVSIPLLAQQKGTYLITWQVVSDDTHPASGSFVFHVSYVAGVWASTTSGNTSQTGFWLQLLAHLLHYLGFALGFGSLAFLLLVLRPLTLVSETIRDRILKLSNYGLLLLIMAEGVSLIAQVVSLHPGGAFDSSIAEGLLLSSFGRVWALRLAAALLLWILLGIARQDYFKSGIAMLILGGALGLLDGTASHAINSLLAWLALLANMLHVTAMGVWLGGLLSLLTLWREKEIQIQRRAVILSFGGLAAIAVIELVLTGIVMAWLYEVRPTNIFSSVYGLVLTAKAASLFIPLLFVAISRKNQHAHKRWWWLELLALLGILSLAATLVTLPPPS